MIFLNSCYKLPLLVASMCVAIDVWQLIFPFPQTILLLKGNQFPAFLSGLLIDVNPSRGISCLNTKLFQPLNMDYPLSPHSMVTFSVLLARCESTSHWCWPSQRNQETNRMWFETQFDVAVIIYVWAIAKLMWWDSISFIEVETESTFVAIVGKAVIVWSRTVIHRLYE